MDEEIFLDTDLCLFLLSTTVSQPYIFVDVPVDRVVALGHANFWTSGDTWRSAVQGLTCLGWTDRVYDYFDGPLREKNFPAHNSMYELRLTCYGGLCVVGNGNHRVVGGRIWLQHKYGEQAAWKQAKVSFYHLLPSARDLLQKASEQWTGIRLAHFSDPYKKLIVNGIEVRRIAALQTSPGQIYALCENELVLLTLPWHYKLHRRLEWTTLGNQAWKDVPARLVKKMLDDDWITQQMETI